MSESINARRGEKNFRGQLLTTASALAFLTMLYAASAARAEDSNADHPTVWIELGGQFEQVDSAEQPFSAPFLSPMPDVFGPAQPFENQKPASYSYGAEGKLTFEPDGMDWAFSAAIRYGRSNRNRHAHHEITHPTTTTKAYLGTIPHQLYGLEIAPDLADVTTRSSEAHAVLDFQAGKDVGLGVFGNRGKSTIGFGVRFAQFTAQSSAHISGVPNYNFQKHLDILNLRERYILSGKAQRSFSGLGPSISWDESALLAGVPQQNVTFDWGLNAAVLFGRQKAHVHHQTTNTQYKMRLGAPPKYYGTPTLHYRHTTATPPRNRSLMIPNLGGFAGLSFNLPSGKVNLGYRADFFFGAMDGGIDVRKTENRGFYGPFATVSIGIGG